MAVPYRPPSANVPLGGGYHDYGAAPHGGSVVPPSYGAFHYGGAAPIPAGSRDLKRSAFVEDQADEAIKPKGKTSEAGFFGFPAKDLLGGLAVFVGPLLLFSMVYLLVSFQFRFHFSVLAWLLVAVALGGVMAVGAATFLLMRKEPNGETDHYTACAAALFIGMLVAFITALALGCANYSHMVTHYEVSQLNSYKMVDPSKADGKALMDAGVLNFVPGTKLDMSKSAGFKNLDMYCVAPIVSATATASYDFWAVGTNCCTGAPNDFHCGDAAENGGLPDLDHGYYSISPGGLRLMSGSELPFYKFAVTQATARYGIQAPNPIFVTWVKDVHKALDGNGHFGTDHFFTSLLWFSIFMLFVVLGAALGTLYIKSKYA